jgi:hypothetical protein
MSRPKGERNVPVRAAARDARRWARRSRFGYPGTEPPEGRNPIRRYGSIGLGILAALVCLGNGLEVGAALALVSFVLGSPRAWTWANDRLSSIGWSAGLGMLAVGEILYAAGGKAERVSLGSRSAGAASILISLSALVALGTYARRWGTGGNMAYTSIRLRKGDPEAMAAVRRIAEREGFDQKHHDDQDD